ncbi:MAG: SdrD B-like domain-containing protein, partial [Kiritimatiellia bacterium]
ADTNAVNEGGTVVFTVSVTNLGPNAAETLVIGDVLPSGLTYVDSTPSQGSYDDGTGQWTVGALAVSNGATLAIEATADLGTGGLTFTNVASLSASVPVDPNPTNNASAVAVTVRGADLQVRKVTDNLRPDEGDPVTYRVSVTNLGPSDTTGVVISDPLPAGVTYVSHVTSLGTYDDGTGLWTVGSLAYGAGAWLDLSVTVDLGTLGTVITNVAAVSAQDLPDPVATNDSAAVRIYVPPLVLYKTASPTGMVQLGDTITYTVTATNIGPWVHTNVVITDVVPAGTVFVPGSVALTAYPARGNTLESVRDEFSAQAFANQDGALAWSADWQEGGESDGPTNGAAQVLATGWASLGLTRSLARAADLSLAESAELSFVLRQATTTRTNNVRDEFGAVAYTNDNGTLTWSGNWLETGDDLSASSGDILVSGGLLSFSGLDANDEIARWAVLSGNTNATLSFNYVGSGLNASRSMNVYVRSNATDYLLASYTSAGSGTASLDLLPYLAASNRIVFRAGGTDWASQSFTVDNVDVALSRPMQTTLDNAYVEVSTNGADWTTLFYANGNVAGTVTTNIDLTAYRSPQTTVRFRTTGYTNAGAQLWFDDVDVELSKIPGADEVGDPPTLLDGWILGTNEGVQLTYDVIVDDETYTTQIVNVASATSDLQPDPVWASATTRVDLVGVEIGDRIWFDADRDGLQDPEETNGIPNVSVYLMRTNGTVVKTVLTDADGNYLFDEVVPGRYFVRVGLTNVSVHVVPTTNFAGGDVAMDSDFTYDTNSVRRADSPAYDFADGTTDHSIDLGLRLLSSTRAEVAEVWGEGRAGAGFVVWRTSSEWNTAGFFVYRVDLETGAETRLNETLVASAFQADGSVYELADPAAAAGGTGNYRLEEVELSGAALDLGTHAIAFGDPLPRPRVATKTLSKAVLTPPQLAGPSPILKVTVRDEGLYGVELQAIAAGMGLALEDVEALAAAGELELSEQGTAVPTIYDAARARLLFHGRGADNWYARDNAYLISRGAGLAMTRREPGATGGETVFPAELDFEEGRYPFDSAAIRPEDFYYWDYVLSATNEKTTSVRSFPLDLTG